MSIETPEPTVAAASGSATRWRLFAVVRPGLEPLLLMELMELLPEAEFEELVGGIAWRGTMEDLWTVALGSRLAEGLRVRVATFKAFRFDQLIAGSSKAPWHAFLPAGATVESRVTCHTSRLYHSDAVAERVEGAIMERLAGRPVKPGAVPPTTPFRIYVRMEDDVCTLSVDAAGELMHRRGYRTEVGKAPARETLAAAVATIGRSLMEEPALVWDPFCGTGSMVIESAMAWAEQEPGEHRAFAFEHWPATPTEAFAAWRTKWLASRPEPVRGTVPRHLGTDIDPRCVSSGERNAERAGVETTVSFAESDAAVADLPCGERDALLVLCNPPYGDRLRGAVDPLRRLRERLLSRRAPTALVMLAPRGLAEGYMARGGRIVAEIRNGGIPVVLLAWSNRDDR